jgi:hypothetical protein
MGLAFAALVVPARSATLHVPADYPTIQAGVDAAAQGDMVLVAPGTYYGAPGAAECVLMNKGIALISEGGAAVTRIDGEGARRVIFSDTSQTGRVIQGFTITGGFVIGYGGGLYIAGSRCSNVTLLDNVIVGNVATTGGGLSLWSTCGALIQGNVFEGNSATYASAFHSDSYHTTFNSNVVVNNVSPYWVMDITEFYGSFYMNDCLVANNSGWGVSLMAQCALEAIFRRCTFAGGQYALISTSNFLSVQLDQTLVVGDIVLRGDDEFCASVATFSHVDIFGTIYYYAGAELVWNQPNLKADPHFCDATGGDFTLAADSPCLPQNNAWGLQIGAFGRGCGPVSLTPSTWARIKAAYR